VLQRENVHLQESAQVQEQRPAGDGDVSAVKEEVQQDLDDSAAQPQVCLTSQSAYMYQSWLQQVILCCLSAVALRKLSTLWSASPCLLVVDGLCNAQCTCREHAHLYIQPGQHESLYS